MADAGIDLPPTDTPPRDDLRPPDGPAVGLLPPDANPAPAFRACEGAVVVGGTCGSVALPCYGLADQHLHLPAHRLPLRERKHPLRGLAAEWRDPRVPGLVDLLRRGVPRMQLRQALDLLPLRRPGPLVLPGRVQAARLPRRTYFGGTGARAHTGDPCTATEECPYRTGHFGPGDVAVCRCTGGRFQCSDEPAIDGGLPEAP
jgi:hypothetical protein